MLIPFNNIQYLTNEKGIKTAVQIPYSDWNNLLKKYSELSKLFALKNELQSGLSDLMKVAKGKSKEITLSEFLNEN